MKHQFCLRGWSVIVVACLVPNILQADDRKEGSNLIQNESLEELQNEVPKGWVQRTWSGEPVFEVESQFGHSGDRCVKISSTTGADASWSYQVELKKNTDYRVSVWVKTDDIGGGGHGVQLNLHELQFEGKTKSIKGTNSWTQLTSEFNSGNREAVLVNLLFGGWGRATGTAWFDDVKLVELIEEPVAMSEAEGREYFSNHVKPILEKHCFDCHGGKEVKAEFVLTNREDLITGGESGEAIDLESPTDSLFLEAINYESYEMPPDGQMSDDEIEILTKWVKAGVPWDGEGFKPEAAEHKEMAPKVNAETKKFWSFQPVFRPDVPDIDDEWISNSIDKFVLNQLNNHDMRPNEVASKQTLIRRVYYDLIGLPPTPKQVQEFVADESPDAYEKLIDQLLASKHYGEKWGRHWLDLVRYAESNSYERDGTKPFVWRYRDYVIRAFNDDKPYDEFIREQLAGDEYDDVTPDRIIATGYYRLGIWDDEPADPEQAWYDDMDDVLATTTKTMLGLTVDCARCHDHKIDPVPQEDYYRFLAFFRNVRRYGVRAHETVLDASTRPIAPQEVQEKYAKEIAEYEQRVKENREALQAIEKVVKEDFIDVEHEEFKYEMNRVPLVEKRVESGVITAEQAEEYKVRFEEMQQLRNQRPAALEIALCVKEHNRESPVTHVLIRGNAHAKGEEVEPGFPSVLSPPAPSIEEPAEKLSSGRRMALANWIASEQNPLTARVMVNRLWQYHFGRGFVRSSSDFGFQGNEPTHPELLDWLAAEFMDGGWKIKRMHKLMMMSSAYRMSSKANEEYLTLDPLNDHFWRFNMKRLTAEEVRDSILAVNNTLNLEKMYGPSIYPEIPQEVLQGQSRPGENWGKSGPEDITRRSIYIHIKRSLPVPLLASFDAADPDSTCPVRFNTVQPTQALAMINGEFLNKQAKIFAEYLGEQAPNDVNGQVRLALWRTLQREPTENEVTRGLDFINELKAGDIDDRNALKHFCLIALNLNEFLFLD